MSDTTMLIASFAVYVVALVFLILFSIRTDRDIFWLVAVPVFVFGHVLYPDAVISSFSAIVISTLVLFIFCAKGDILHGIAMIFAILGGIFGQLVGRFWMYPAIIFIILLVVGKYLPEEIRKNLMGGDARPEKEKTVEPDMETGSNDASAAAAEGMYDIPAMSDPSASQVPPSVM